MFARGEGLRILSLEVREPAGGSSGWRALVDGRSLIGLAPKSQESWRLKDGALEPTTTGPFLLVTRDDLGDGEIRIVMEARQLVYLTIDARLTSSGKTRTMLGRPGTTSLERRKFEVLLRCSGDQVSGTLDGQPLTFSVLGPTASGAIRLQGEGDGIRVHSVDSRPLR
jgi:hypothetical protein